MANRIDRAAADIAAEWETPDGTLRELAKSNRLLAKAALIKARGYDDDDDEFEDEVAAQQEDDHDEYDEEEDEDQDPDNPDLGSGKDDLRGVVGRRKKGRRDDDDALERSRRRKAAEKAEDDLVRAKLRLKKAQREEDEAEADADEDRLEEARESRQRAEKALNRARGKLRRAKPAWVGDEDDEEADHRRRANDWDDVYAEGEDSYYTNEDANHEEDEIVPPDGPDVADGDDVDQYTIGAHKVHSKRAMRRSRQGVPGREALYRSMAQDGRITEELLDAAPALEAIAELLGDQQDYLAKSAGRLTRQEGIVRALAANAVTQNKAIQRLAKSLDQVLRQPQTGPMWGLPPALGVVPGGKTSAKTKIQKSRTALLSDAEEAMAQGLLDAETFQAMGRVGDNPDAIMELAPAPLRQQLGWK